MQKYFIIVLIIFSSCKKGDETVTNTAKDVQGKILFISRRIPNSADWQMFIMNGDGSDQHAVSNNLVQCSPPVISNDRSKIAFASYDNLHNNLYIIDTDGQHLQLLSTGKQFCGNAAWSPDDTRLAFVKNDQDTGGNNDIYSIRADGSDEIRLTNEQDNFSPRYLPDNSAIIFASSNSAWTGIYKMTTAGTEKKLLTAVNKSFSDPRVSPDGKMIAFTSNDWAGSQIFVMSVNGGTSKKLTSTFAPDYFDTGFPRDGNYNPVWSPNSQKIAYVSYENGSPDVFVINADGTGNKRLTNTPLRDENPAWTKDGNYILYSSNRDVTRSADIYRMKINGEQQTPLTNYAADDIYPAFIDR